MDNMKLLSLNVRGLRGKKRYVIYNYLKENNFKSVYCKKHFAQMILYIRLDEVGKVISYTAVALLNTVEVCVSCFQRI